MHDVRPGLRSLHGQDDLRPEAPCAAASSRSTAVKCAVEKALECKKKNEKKTIVFNLSGHGILDVGGYQKFLEGKM